MDLPELPELCRNFPIYRPWEKVTETPKYLYLMENYNNYRDCDYETGERTNIYYEWRLLTDQKQFITNLYGYILAEEMYQKSDYCDSNSSDHIRLTLIPINEQLKRTLTTKIRKHINPYQSYQKDLPYINGVRFELNLEFMNGVLDHENNDYLREPTWSFNRLQSEEIRLMYTEDKLLNPTTKLPLTEYIEEFQEFRKICFYPKLERLPWVNSCPPTDSFSESSELMSSMVHSILKPSINFFTFMTSWFSRPTILSPNSVIIFLISFFSFFGLLCFLLNMRLLIFFINLSASVSFCSLSSPPPIFL